MSAITHLIIWVVGTFLIYLWYRHWIKELKENGDNDKPYIRHSFMYSRLVELIIGIIVIIMIIRLIIYGNIYIMGGNRDNVPNMFFEKNKI